MIKSYDELPIGGCMRLYEANDIEDDVEKVAAIVAVLTGKTRDEVMALPVPEFAALQAGCAWVYDDPQPAKPKEAYIVGGVVCKVTRTIGAMTAAQFIDFQNCATNDGDIVDVLACALVPEGKTYGNGYDYDELKQAISDTLPTTDALCIFPFFIASLLRSSAAVLTSSGRALRRQARRAKDKEMKATADWLLRAGDSLSAGAGYRLLKLWRK